MKELLIELRDLLAFERKHAKRHGLDRVSLTVPRANLILNQINEALKKK